MTDVDKYLEATGQTFQELLSGAATYGAPFIIDELVPKALEQKKKIIWNTRLTNGEDLGMVDYELQDL